MQLKINDLKIQIRKLKKSFYVGNVLVDKYRFIEFKGQFDNIVLDGEIPQLPLFYDEQEDELKLLVNTIFDLDLSNIDFTKDYFNVIKNISFPTNIRFALEQILLNYFENIKEILTPLPLASAVMINALDTGDDLQESSLVKLKIGRKSIQQDKVKISKYINNETKLRLDGNGMLVPNDLDILLEGIDLSYIEYIEEPFIDIDTWNQSNYNVGIALDENLDQYLNAQMIKNLKALIIKPSLKLGISGVLRLHKQINQRDLTVIISSSFEINKSFSTLVRLSQLFKGPHGLGTYSKVKLEASDLNVSSVLNDQRQLILTLK